MGGKQHRQQRHVGKKPSEALAARTQTSCHVGHLHSTTSFQGAIHRGIPEKGRPGVLYCRPICERNVGSEGSSPSISRRYSQTKLVEREHCMRYRSYINWLIDVICSSTPPEQESGALGCHPIEWPIELKGEPAQDEPAHVDRLLQAAAYRWVPADGCKRRELASSALIKRLLRSKGGML